MIPAWARFRGVPENRYEEAEMAFAQIITLSTSKADEMAALDQEWVKATEGKRTARRRIVLKDRNDPNRYYDIVFFDSYESAMENSNMPETSDFAGRMAALCDGPMQFADCDVVEEVAY